MNNNGYEFAMYNIKENSLIKFNSDDSNFQPV